VWSVFYQLMNIQEKLHLFKFLHRNHSDCSNDAHKIDKGLDLPCTINVFIPEVAP